MSFALFTWCEELTPWKRPWCWERLKAGGEQDDRGRDGWMASPNQWTWVSASSGGGNGQGSLVCHSPWGSKELDTTERLNEESNYFHPPPSVTIASTQQYQSHHILDSREHRNSSPFLRLKSLKLDTRISAISHFPTHLVRNQASTWHLPWLFFLWPHRTVLK